MSIREKLCDLLYPFFNIEKATSYGLFNRDEFEIMHKYRKPSILDRDDKDLVYKLTGINFMTLGFHQNEDFSVSETTKHTDIGYRVYWRQRVMGTPIVRQTYILFRYVS